MLRKVIRSFRRRLRQNLSHRQRAAGNLQGVDWQSGLDDENDFWTNALTDPEHKWDISEYRERTNPDFELQPELRALIPAPEGATVRILDVGAGPLTRVGKKWSGRKIEITATDPLAERYTALTTRLKVPVLVPVQKFEAEKLSESFPKDHFDLAYASNCLDHSYDPVEAIRQMLLVVKPGRHVYLWHFANAGKEECYQGLHQWNFELEGGHFTVSDGRKTRRVGDELGALVAGIQCSETRAFNARVIIAQLRRAG